VSTALSLSIQQPDESIKIDAAAMLDVAGDIVIADNGTALLAQNLRTGIAKRIDELSEQRLEITRPIDKAKKSIMALFAAPIDLLERAKKSLDSKIIAWDDAQRRERERLQCEADEAAAVERRRLQAIADAERARAPAIAAVADHAITMVVAAPVAVPIPARAAGVSMPTHYTFEIVDASKIKAEFMTPDLVAIGKLVRSLHEGAEERVGGIRVKAERSVANRG
jgi:hypothetical protein